MGIDGVSDAQVRAALREHGLAVGGRGKLSAANYDAYREIAGEPAAADDDGHWPSAGLDDDPAPPAAPGPAEGMPAVEPEQRPRPSSSRTGAMDRARQLWDKRPGGPASDQGRPAAPRRGGGSTRKKKRPEQPWRPTAGVIETVWTRAAQAAGAMPPLQRILAAQAPMAGLVLEQRMRDTVTDRLLLQPAARMEAQGEAVMAMAGVPVMTALIAFRGRVRMVSTPQGPVPVIGPDGMPQWEEGTQLMVGMLKVCLVSWMEVTEQHGEAIIAKAEASVQRGKDADDLIRWIFGPANPDQTWEDVQQEAGRRAAPFAGDDGAGDEPGEAPPTPRGGSSAFRPALSASVLGPP